MGFGILKTVFLKKYKSIMEKPEEHRERWALGLSVFFTAIIFVGFGFYKGFLNFGGMGAIANQTYQDNMANVVSAKSVPSPIESTKQTFEAAFGEIGKQYQQLKDSMSSVLVPFISNIEVYQRK